MVKKLSIQFLVFLLLFEVSTYVYFRFISNDRQNLKNYIQQRISVNSYSFNSKVGLVTPKPKSYIVHYNTEFEDKFLAQDIFNLGLGFFDDGLDDRKIKSVAIGDSFTKGVGSIDNLKNGWVELVEKDMEDIDIANLGGFGSSVHTQKYFYDQLKSHIDHNVIIYNFFSGGDYIENLDDRSFQYYIKRKSNELSDKKLQKMINEYNSRFGFKFYLEYLSNYNYRSYSIYFLLKIFDLLLVKDYFKKFDHYQYKIPGNEARLNIVEEDLYVETEEFGTKNPTLKYTVRCPDNKKYCYKHDHIFENEKLKNKIVDNTAIHINNFFKEADDIKEFIVVIHPSRRNFYPDLTKINYNELDTRLIEKLDKKIKIIYLKEDLLSYHNESGNIFYKRDGHYTVYGYKVVSEIISENLKKIFN